MADYRFSAAIVSRSKGRSAVAAAAYRAGEKLHDERTGEIKDYQRRSWSVLYTRILTPENAPSWMLDRQRLWNGVEHREDRSTKPDTAQLARNIELSLPCELTHEQHVELLCDFVQAEFVGRGMVADVAIHAPPYRGDGTNHHAHVLLTMRDIEDGGFGNKNRAWNKEELLEHWRERWADYQNRALEKYGFETRVDHRSLEDQGLDREPTTHLGPTAQALEDQGVPTDRGDQNRRIKSANHNLALAKEDLANSEKRLAALKRRYAAERMEDIQKIVRAVREADTVRKDEGSLPLPPEPEPPAPPTPTPRRSRLTAAERIEQVQKTIHAADDFWKEPRPRQAPAPEPPAKQPEPKPEPEPPKLPTPPIPSGPAPRGRRPSAYDLIARMKYTERAKEEEEKQTAEREREEAKERERKPDRER